MQAVYLSRRGLLPSVRAFIDYLAKHLPDTPSIMLCSVVSNHTECAGRHVMESARGDRRR